MHETKTQAKKAERTKNGQETDKKTRKAQEHKAAPAISNNTAAIGSDTLVTVCVGGGVLSSDS